MSAERMLLAGGLLHFGFAGFHLAFWRLFGWGRDLASLTSINRAVMQILNSCLIAVFVVFGYLSLAYPAELISSALGRAMLIGIVVFWVLRAIEQWIFFGIRHPVSQMFFGGFLMMAMLYLLPVIEMG